MEIGNDWFQADAIPSVILTLLKTRQSSGSIYLEGCGR